MNVKQLRKMLEGLPGDMPVVMSRDGEGNGFMPMYDGEVMFYSPRWGDVVPEEYMEEYGHSDSTPALVLWPDG